MLVSVGDGEDNIHIGVQASYTLRREILRRRKTNAVRARLERGLAEQGLAPTIGVSTSVANVAPVVAVDTMPGWLQPFATYQPVSVAVDAMRSLMLGGQFHDPAKVVGSLAWSVGIVAVFAPLAVRVYRRTA